MDSDYTRGFCPTRYCYRKNIDDGYFGNLFCTIKFTVRKNIASTFENEAKLLADRAEDSVFDFYTRLDWLHQFSPPDFVNII